MRPEYYNKPDRCPKCGASNVERKSTAPSNMEYDMGRDWYECHSCNFTEDVTIDWAGGRGLPESEWWSITKYPIGWWEETIQNGAAEVVSHYESLDYIKKRMDHASTMIGRLKK